MVSRPVILIPVWGFCALGFRRAVYQGKGIGIHTCLDSAEMTIYIEILLFSLSVAAVYILNQIADIEVDKKNDGIPLVASGVVSVRAAAVTALFCSAVSILLPLFYNHYFFSLAALLSLLLGCLYSFRPVRLSGRPFSDFLSNAIGYGLIAFGVGWSLGDDTVFSIRFLQSALPYFLLMCGGSISSTLPDYRGDIKDKKNTTAVIFGLKGAHSIAAAFISAAFITGFMQKDCIATGGALLSFPFYLGYFFTGSRFFMEATYKIGGGLCMFGAFLALPLFLPLAAVVFIATWLYFRIRHGISNPSLVPLQTNR